STALWSPKLLTRSTTSIMGDDCVIALLLLSSNSCHYGGKRLTSSLQEAFKQMLQHLLLLRLKTSKPLLYDLAASTVPCLHMFMPLRSEHHAHHSLIVVLALPCHKSCFFQAFASSSNRTTGDAKRFGQLTNTKRTLPA